MDKKTIHRNKKSTNYRNKHYRLQYDKIDNYPDGFVEEWSSAFSSTSTLNPISESSSKNDYIFTPVSVVLSIQDNIKLSKDNDYLIRFDTGMIEGSGITVSDSGNEISFQHDGSYRFEICGDGIVFTDIDVLLSYYYNDLPIDLSSYSIVPVPKSDNKLLLRGIPVVIPIQKNGKVTPKLIPSTDETIVINNGTKLLIHRVA